LAGGLVGAIGDLIGYFINPIGAYMPHFTLTAALRGIIPGVIILLARRGRREVGIFPLFVAVCSTLVITDIFMVPYFIESLFGLSRVITVPTAYYPKCYFHSGLYSTAFYAGTCHRKSFFLRCWREMLCTFQAKIMVVMVQKNAVQQIGQHFFCNRSHRVREPFKEHGDLSPPCQRTSPDTVVL
jgi:hypothetical protein